MAVGYAGTIVTSKNGFHWTRRQSTTEQRLLGVAYGGGLFVAAGWNGVVLTSPNGKNWTQRNVGASGHFRSVSFRSFEFITAQKQ